MLLFLSQIVWINLLLLCQSLKHHCHLHSLKKPCMTLYYHLNQFQSLPKPYLSHLPHFQKFPKFRPIPLHLLLNPPFIHLSLLRFTPFLPKKTFPCAHLPLYQHLKKTVLYLPLTRVILLNLPPHCHLNYQLFCHRLFLFLLFCLPYRPVCFLGPLLV